MFFFLFAYNYDKPEFLHKVLYEILEKEVKGIVLHVHQSV